MAASYFDVDGTLVKTNLIQPTLFYLLNQATPLKSLKKLGFALARAPQMVLAELRDRRLFNEVLFSVYAGVSEDRLELLSGEVYEKVLAPALFPFARDLVAGAKRAGHEVVLVSGALDSVLEHLRKSLQADSVIANRLEIKDGAATGKMLRPVVAGPNKSLLVRNHARAHGHDLEACFAYSDSYSDVPMLSVVGHPAAVNPDARLRLLAKSYAWPIFDLERDEPRRRSR
jgi:HAD superfamily hydrolase (TIGR01490 family)